MHPFLIDHSSVRGRMVRLNEVVDTILHRHDYPLPVSYLLAELILLATMMTPNLKQRGILTVQVRGNGPVKLMVVDAQASGEIRGYADLAEGGAEALTGLTEDEWTMEKVLGKGYLVMTLDQTNGKNPYQGIVELQGDSLTEALEGYFSNSEQTMVQVKTAIDREDDRWRAGGLMLQRVPLEGGNVVSVGTGELLGKDEAQDEHWQRATLFARTIQPHELLDPGLSPEKLLYHLFNEDGVWVYEPSHFKVGCRCSRERVVQTLRLFPKEEMLTLTVDGTLSVTCQFCNQTQEFSELELARLYRPDHPTA